MIAELILRSDPSATIALVSFIVVGIIACLGWLWFLWWTQWEYPCGHTPKNCTSACWNERNGR